jgi:predicted transcriptional regulator
MPQHRCTTIRLPPDLLEQVDTLARLQLRTRQAQIEHLIRAGLEATRETQGGRQVVPYPPLRRSSP